MARIQLHRPFDLTIPTGFGPGRFGGNEDWIDHANGLSYDFPRLPCDKGAAARHPKYAGQRRGTDREWVGRCGPCGSVIAPVFSHDLNG